MTAVPLDRFLRHDELTSVLHALAADHPDLVTVESIGRSYEGRDIWLATVTDASTGPADEKPAMWVDANIHATELTASVAALALVRHLVDHRAHAGADRRRILHQEDGQIFGEVRIRSAVAVRGNRHVHDPKYRRGDGHTVSAGADFAGRPSPSAVGRFLHRRRRDVFFLRFAPI